MSDTIPSKMNRDITILDPSKPSIAVATYLRAAKAERKTKQEYNTAERQLILATADIVALIHNTGANLTPEPGNLTAIGGPGWPPGPNAFTVGDVMVSFDIDEEGDLGEIRVQAHRVRV